MDDIVIRVAGPDDAGLLSVLGRETFVDTFVKGFAIPYPEEDLATFFAQAYTPEVYARAIADPSRRVWLAERGGEAVAYATAGDNALPHPEARPGEGELKAFYVRREMHGSGLASRVMDTALARLDPGGGRGLGRGGGGCGSACGPATCAPSASMPAMGSRRSGSTSTPSAASATGSSSCGAADRRDAL